MRRAIAVLPALLFSWAISPAHAQKVERVTIAGGPPAGVFGIFATGISTYLSRGGSVENVRRINSKEGEMGLSFSSDLHEAFFGQEKFTGKPLTDLRSIGLVFFGVAHAENGLELLSVC